jgi:hypothetical protein
MTAAHATGLGHQSQPYRAGNHPEPVSCVVPNQPRHLAPTASDPGSWRAAFPRGIYNYIYQPKMPFVKQPLRCRSHGPSRENRFSSPTRHSEALRPACGRWIARSGHPEKPHGQCPRKKTRNWASQSGRLMPEGLGAFDLLIFDNPTRHDDCPQSPWVRTFGARFWAIPFTTRGDPFRIGRWIVCNIAPQRQRLTSSRLDLSPCWAIIY